MQCVIGYDDVAMVAVVRAARMIERITEQTDKLWKVKLIMSNCQNNDDPILTSNQSTIGLDDEVIV